MQDDLEWAAEVLAKATKGPWRAEAEEDAWSDGQLSILAPTGSVVEGEEFDAVCYVAAHLVQEDDPDESYYQPHSDDAAAIALLGTVRAELLAVVEVSASYVAFHNSVQVHCDDDYAAAAGDERALLDVMEERIESLRAAIRAHRERAGA